MLECKWSSAILIFMITFGVSGAVADDIQEMSSHIDTMWPSSGVTTLTVLVTAKCEDTEGGEVVSKFTDRKKFKAVFSPKYHSVASWKLDDSGEIVGDVNFEMLENPVGRFRSSQPLKPPYTLEHTPAKNLDQAKGINSLSLSAGFLGSEQNSFIGALIAANAKAAEITKLADEQHVMRFKERDGRAWEIFFDAADNGGSVLFTKLTARKSWPKGLYRTSASSIESIAYTEVDSGWVYPTSFVERSEMTYEGGMSRSTETTFKVIDHQYDPEADAAELSFQFPPPDGSRVMVNGSEWLHHEWRNGKITQVTDPDAMKRLEQFEFTNQQSSSRWWWMILGGGLLAAVAVWFWKFRSVAVLIAALTLMPSADAADKPIPNAATSVAVASSKLADSVHSQREAGIPAFHLNSIIPKHLIL